jgi:filamentous hemagglutinin family protein
MAKRRRADKVKLLGVVRRKRAALMVSTALQATAMFVLSLPADAQPAPNARPTGGVVVAGSAAIGQTANTTTINQSTQRAAVNWQSFDVGSQQRVDFRQPSASAMTLNRVIGADPSRIAGRIDANGQVVLVNQSGVTFFKGAQVNTNGLMVSAIGITNQNFMAGKMVFDRPGNPNARVENQGTITVREAGLAALVAPQVANSGVINAKLGHVVLAGAKTATLDLYGDGLLSLDVSNQVTQAPVGADGKPVTALVTNTGVIVADGGTVQLTARAADGVVQNLVNAGGKIRAATVGNAAGMVALGGVGGSIVVEGQLSAPGRAPGTVGGDIEIATTGNVTVASSARINASGKAGGGVVAVGTTLARAKGGPSVMPTVVAANVIVQSGARITANATGTGNGGTVTVLSAGSTQMDGHIVAKGGPGGGNGGFVEVSGVSGFSLNGPIDVSAPRGASGTILLDPDNLEIINGAKGSGDQDTTLGNNGTLQFSDPNTKNNQVSNGEIDSLTGTIILQATTNIAVDANTPIALKTDANLILQTNVGSISIGIGSPITASGTGFVELQAGLVAKSGGSLMLGSNISADSTKGFIALQADGGINLGAATLSASAIDLVNITSGGVSQTTGALKTAALHSSSGVAGSVSLTSTANAVGALVLDFAVTGSGSSFSLTNAANQSLDIRGTLSAPQDVTLTTSGTGAITTEGTSVISGAHSVLLKGSSLSLAGTINDGGATPGTGIVGLTATGPGIAGSISADTGTVIAGTLTGSATGAASLNNAGNAIANLDTFETGGGFVLNDGALSGTLAIMGPVISSKVSIVGASSLSINNTVSATAVGGSVSLAAGTGGIALNAGHVVRGTNVALATAAGGGITQDSGGSIVAGTLTSSGIGGDAALISATNAIGTIGPFTATGSLNLTDTSPLTVSGTVQSTAGNVYLQSSGGSVTFGAGARVQSAAGDTVGLQADAISNLGGLAINGAVDTGGGTFELAPNTAGKAVTLGAPGGLSLLSLAGIAADVLRIGAVTQPGGSLAATAGSIAINGIFDASGKTLDLRATTSGGGTGAVTESLFSHLNAGTLVGDATSLTLTGLFGNSIATLGTVTATGGSFVLNDSGLVGSLTIAGAVTSATGNVSITGASTISVLGSVGASGTTLLNSGTGGISLAAGAALSGTVVDVSTAGGGLSEDAGASITTGTLQSSGALKGTVSLAGTANGIGDLGNLAVGGGNLFLVDGQALDVIGTVSTGANQRVSFQTDKFSNTGSIITGVMELAPNASTGGTVTLGTTGAGLSLASVNNISIAPTGSLVIGRITTPSGTVTTASAISIDDGFGSKSIALELDANGPITQTATLPAQALTASSLSGGGTSISLLNAGNAIPTVGTLVATSGSLLLADASALNINGTASATGNVFLATPSGVTIGNGATVAAGASKLVSIETGGLINSGTVTGGTFEVAPFPGGALLLGSGGNLPSLSGIGPTTVRIGAVTIPNVGLTTTAGSISVGGNFGTSAISLDLESTGGISESSLAVLTAGTLTGNAGTTVALGGVNAIGTLNSFSVASGSFTLADGGATSLAVNGTVSADNAAITGAPTLAVNGTVHAVGDVQLVAGAGGVLINAGALVNGGTVDLGSAGGGVTESGGGLIIAGTLISSTGVSGSVSLASANSIGAVGAFVAGGNFDLIDGGVTNLTVTGPLVANGVTISGAPTLSITGGVAATTKGLLTAGTIALGAGAVVTGATLDLSAGSGGIALTGNAALGQAGALIDMTTSGGGVTEAATASVTAATLQSTGGIKGAVDLAGVGNKIGTIALFKVSGGPFSLVDTGPLDVAGTLSASGITIVDSGALTVSGDLIATSAVSLTGSNITIPGLVSDGGSGTTSLIADAGNINETGTLIAGTLSGRSLGSTNINGALPTTNQVSAVGTFRANTTSGNFDLSDNGNTTNLAITGPISAGGVDVTAGGSITVSGAVTATNGAVEFAAGAGIAINMGGMLSGSTVELTSGGAVSEAGGMIIAGTLLSFGGVAGGVILNSANNIGAIASPSLAFVINNGDFSLNDGGSASGLAILGLVFANNITITNLTGPLAIGANNGDLDSKGALIVNGSAGLTVNAAGIIQGDTIDLSFTSGGVTEAPTGVMLAGTLQSAGGIVGTVDLPGNLNAINNINSLTVTGGTFNLFDESGTVSNLRVLGKLAADSITIAAGPQLTVSGSLVASSGISLSGGAITLSGFVSDGGFGTTTLNANNISEPGTIIAGTLTGTLGTADLMGATATANRVLAIGNVDASSFSLRDGANLVVTGTLAGGSSTTLVDKGTLAIDGAVTAASVSATADSITINGLIDGATVSLVGTTGSVGETGTLIAGTLSGSAASGANFSGATATTNRVGFLNGFSAGAGFTLNDGIALTETNTVSGGPSATILDNGALAINGSLTATAINLTANSIAIPGNVSGGTVALIGTVGTISETGTISAGTLTGSAATSASLTGATTTTNHVGLVNGFTASSGFTLDDGVALAVANTVSGGTNVTILDKGALTIGGTVTAASVGLTADSITIPGNVSGGAVMLVGTVGAISETGALVAGTLTGSAATSATLTGASVTTNQVGTLNGFKAANGFTLNDGTGLTVTDALAGGPNATIVDNGALAINGAVTATAVGLTANSITVSGSVGGNSAALDATNGAIIINGAVSASAVSLTADGIVVSGNVTGNSVSLNATNGAITINGVVNGTTTSLTGTSIVIPGIVNGNSVTAVATAGAINETGALNIGTLTGAASGSASFTGTNSIASLGPFSSNGLTLIDNSNLGIIGVVNAGTSAAINVAGSLNIGGALIANTIALNATNGISSPGAIAAANSVNLVTNGSISETGALITDVLTGSAIGNVTLTGNAASNQVAELGRFTSGGTFTLTDNIGLLITGPLSAPKIVITDANGPVTLANGATIITSGTARPPGAIANADLPTAATSGFGAFLAVQSFTQVGNSTIEGNPSILRIDVTGPGNITLSQSTDTGLTGTGTWLILGLQTGQATGSTFVQNLDVIQTGGSGSTQLTGTVGGFSGPAAAGAAGIQPGPGSNFRFNSCPIASVNCVLVSALAIPTANPLNDINVGSLYNPNDQDDLLLPIVSDQDY